MNFIEFYEFEKSLLTKFAWFYLDNLAIRKTLSMRHNLKNEKLTLLTKEPSANSTINTIDSKINGQTVIKIFLTSFDFYILTTQYIDHIRDITEKFRHGLCD